jgi:hypothetical protein
VFLAFSLSQPFAPAFSKVTLNRYARSRGADPKAIRRAIDAGIIQRDGDGRIDPTQADAAWASTRRASRMAQHQHDDTGRRSAKAKIAVTLAKLRLIKQRVEMMRERFVDRVEAVAVGEQEATYVLDSLRAAPASYAATLAKEMAIPKEAAQRILDRFVGLTLIEIGDLARQARRDAERA